MMHDLPKHRLHDPEAIEREFARIHRDAILRDQVMVALRHRCDSSPWFVIRVHGSELKLAEAMQQAGVTAWCPQRKVLRRKPRSRAKYEGLQPLAPGYLFVSFEVSNEALVALKMFDQVDQLLGVNGKPWPLSAKEIDYLRKADQTHEPDKRGLGMIFTKGEMVEVVDGPFFGLEAMVESGEDRKGMVPVLFNILGRLTPVSIGLDVLRKVG